MDTILIAGNWKSNKTTSEAMEWLQKLSAISFQQSAKECSIVLCVPFTLLYLLKQEIERLHLPLELGAQDVSPFADGAYTGEVSARQIKELASWVIIGHSERRKYFGETDEILSQKVIHAKSVGLSVLYCVPDDVTIVPGMVDAVAYEPVWAIGTGKSDTPENANSVIRAIKAKCVPDSRNQKFPDSGNLNVPLVIYGGSVTSENVASFIAQPAVDGVLPGGASMDPVKFANLIKNAIL